jgi:hypothetical protein
VSRRTVSVVLFLAALAAAWAWWRWAPASLPGIAQRSLPASPSARPENPPLYKWRDARGQWHVTDVPPTDRAYETVVVDPHVNEVPSILKKEDGEED